MKIITNAVMNIFIAYVSKTIARLHHQCYKRTKQVKTLEPDKAQINTVQKTKYTYYKKRKKKQNNEKIREIYTKVKHTMNGETGSYGYKITP